MRVAARRVRRWLTCLVALGAIAVTAHIAFDALRASRNVFRYSKRHARESLEFAQDRLFGASYMASIREARKAIGIDQTVYFVDDRSDPQWTYFALFHLAPRRLVRFARVGEPIERVTKGPNRRARLLVRVPLDGKPLELVSLADLPPPTSKRARKARQ